VFDKIDKVVGNGKPGSINKPSFIATVGDSIYPAVADAPTTDDWNQVLGLFKRPNLASLPVYNVRGNHDVYFDWRYELALSNNQTQWKLPAFYYTKMVPAGPNGELMGIMFIDTVLLLCAENVHCADPSWVSWG
jgi:hypothetical protein